MHEKLLNYKNLASEKWNSLDKGLKVRVMIFLIGLITILGITIYLTAKPNWVVLKSNSDEETIGKIQNMFNDAGIKNRVIDRATSIEVIEKNLNQAKILIAGSDIAKKGFNFDEVSKKIGIGMTENDKKEVYKRAKEEEVKDLITTFNDVYSADVILALPDDTVIFNNNKNVAKASVTLNIGPAFTREQAATIANLVTSSVEGLKIENVNIADQSGKLLYSGSENSTFSLSTKDEMEKNKYNEIEGKIEETLAPLFDEVKIISNIKFDWDKKQEKNVTYSTPIDESNVGVPKTQVEQSENVINGNGGSEPGIESNNQTPTNYAMAGENKGTYDSSNKETEYLYNSQEETKEIQGGTMIPDQSSISVVVYKNKYFYQDLLKRNKTINKEMTWEDYKQSNSNETLIEIDERLLESIKVGTGIDNVTIVGYEKPVFKDAVKKPIKTEQIIVLVILVILISLLAFALIKKAQPDTVEEIEPEISIEDLISGEQHDENKSSEVVVGISEIESEYKTKIDKFIDENAEAAAQLLRNWLNDEWE